MPGDRVVFDEDLARAGGLLQEQGYARAVASGQPLDRPAVVYAPDCWTEAGKLDAGYAAAQPGGAILFLHERQSPGGRRRLVVLRRGPKSPLFYYLLPLTFSAQLIDPATRAEGPTVVAALVPTDLDLRIPADLLNSPVRCFAGQPDPDDPSHFTVRLELGATPGTIDGWLEDDDRVRLKFRLAPTDRPALVVVSGTMHFGPRATGSNPTLKVGWHHTNFNQLIALSGGSPVVTFQPSATQPSGTVKMRVDLPSSGLDGLGPDLKEVFVPAVTTRPTTGAAGPGVTTRPVR